MLGLLPEVDKLEEQQPKLYRDEKHLAESLIKIQCEFRGQISKSFRLRMYKSVVVVMLAWNSNAPSDLTFNYDICTKSDIRQAVPINKKPLFAHMYSRGKENMPLMSISMIQKWDFN